MHVLQPAAIVLNRRGKHMRDALPPKALTSIRTFGNEPQALGGQNACIAAKRFQQEMPR